MERCINTKEDILKRLRRIEGQVKGVQRMVEEEKLCSDILIQIAAVRAAINKVGGIILENHSKNCLLNALNEEDQEKQIGELIDIVIKYAK